MNPLMNMYEQLAVALTTEPLLCLATAVAAFDPFWRGIGDDTIDYECDPLDIALQVTRNAFPDIYAEAVERLRAGAAYQELNRLLCRAVSGKGITHDDIEMIGWGVPLTAAGVDLEDPEFYAVHNDLLPILRPFRIECPVGETYHVDVPEGVFAVGCAIASSLHKQTDPDLCKVGWAFGWLFGCTGNSLVDYTDEALGEIPPLSWSEDDIAFAVELMEEADSILHDAQVGLELLQAWPDLMTALERNVTILRRELKKKGKLDEHTLRLEWPNPGNGVDRTAVFDTLVL